jgi:hypothetical protein
MREELKQAAPDSEHQLAQGNHRHTRKKSHFKLLFEYADHLLKYIQLTDI